MNRPIFAGYPHDSGRYPHEGCCSGCRDASVCNVCGKPFNDGFAFLSNRPHCTNGRCRNCHNEWCTPGGETTPGHGFWRKPIHTEPLVEEAAVAITTESQP